MPADMSSFTDYFERTWIGSSTTQPLFPHYSWNHHDDSLMLLPRSSNIAEGWHNGFRSMMACSNPTIWKFIDCLKKEQNLTDTKISKRAMREAPPRREKKWITYDQNLQTMIGEYDNFDSNLEYLRSISIIC